MDTDFKCFSFKTRVILIDDNESFLNNLSFKLSDDYLVETYSDPYLALEDIASNYQGNILSTPHGFLSETESEDDDIFYSVDFQKIAGLSKSKQKTNTVSVVIVDYSMPILNGIEFCKKLAHLPVLKVMLTGHADFKLAVDAFNNGIIDRFIVKDTPDMLKEIVNGIDLMAGFFFERISSPLLSCFSSKKETPVISKEYMEHFNEVVVETKAIEFYILDSLGSYLLVTESGEKYYFIILLDSHLDEYIELAIDMSAQPEIINKMTKKTHAPIFIDEMDYKLPVTGWGSLLFPIQKTTNYYYSVFSEKMRKIEELSYS